MAKKALDRIQERFNQDPQIGKVTTLLPGDYTETEVEEYAEVLKREREREAKQ